MFVFKLDSENINFPPVDFANKHGILAIGGDLSVKRLINAYANGIFPWYNENEPIIWWSPDPRFVLFLDDFKISKSLKKFLKKNIYSVTYDKNFLDVITNCSTVPRLNQDGTWITEEMIEAYYNLHKEGFAHSVEVWENNNLVGGLYGVSLGRMFFGESMFSKKDNASKVALVNLVNNLKKYNFEVIDSQVYTDNIFRFGGKNISRAEYINILNKNLQYETLKGNWGKIFS